MVWRVGVVLHEALSSCLAPPYEFREFFRQFDEIRSKSLPLIALAGTATGVVMSLQTHDRLVRFGTKSFLPAVIAFSLVKESGPDHHWTDGERSSRGAGIGPPTVHQIVTIVDNMQHVL
jgi:ABC-type transporter Mla maintaining outer membrane lipid asymmetry permease subunit MlaE